MTSYGRMERPEPELVEATAKFPSATLHEAMGREGALPAAIKPVAPGMTVCGPAVTVQRKAAEQRRELDPWAAGPRGWPG